MVTKEKDLSYRENKMSKSSKPEWDWDNPYLSLFMSDSPWQLSWYRQSRTGDRCCRLREITLPLSTSRSFFFCVVLVCLLTLLFWFFKVSQVDLSHNYSSIIMKTEDAANSNQMFTAITSLCFYFYSISLEVVVIFTTLKCPLLLEVPFTSMLNAVNLKLMTEF